MTNIWINLNILRYFMLLLFWLIRPVCQKGDNMSTPGRVQESLFAFAEPALKCIYVFIQYLYLFIININNIIFVFGAFLDPQGHTFVE